MYPDTWSASFNVLSCLPLLHNSKYAENTILKGDFQSRVSSQFEVHGKQAVRHRPRGALRGRLSASSAMPTASWTHGASREPLCALSTSLRGKQSFHKQGMSQLGKENPCKTAPQFKKSDEFQDQPILDPPFARLFIEGF